MPYYYTRICPICQKAGVQDISRHLCQAHNLSPDERKPYLKAARLQLPNDHNVRSNSIELSNRSKVVCGKAPSTKMKQNPAKAILPTVMKQAVADKNPSKTWSAHSYTDFKLKHPFSMQVVGPRRILCGKCSTLQN